MRAPWRGAPSLPQGDTRRAFKANVDFLLKVVRVLRSSATRLSVMLKTLKPGPNMIVAVEWYLSFFGEGFLGYSFKSARANKQRWYTGNSQKLSEPSP